jgi:hypothetical protein
MRLGMNPQKQEKKLTLATNHRIVVVVYIPNEEGFYKDSYNVFKTCIDSLVTTTSSSSLITVVNNGSFAQIGNLLNEYLEQGKIDTLISHKTNIGKIDALIGAARGAREKLITLTDSDILFVKGWQHKTIEIFNAFPNVGSVSPIPVRYGYHYGTSSVLKDILLKKLKLTLSPIPENFTAYNRYLESINWPVDKNENTEWAVVTHKNIKAILGSGHQVLTIDRDVLFKTVPTNPSLTLVGGKSEYQYVDEPIDKAGKLRLATYNNFAFHMGNKLEDWMAAVQKENEEAPDDAIQNMTFGQASADLFHSDFKDRKYTFRKKLLKKIIKLLRIDLKKK